MHSRPKFIRSLIKHGFSTSQILTYLQIRSALSDCRSVLDIGCGPDSVMQYFGFERLVGFEGYEPAVEEARKRGTHHQLVLGDVRNLGSSFKPEEFDAVVALDLIEHLPKADGLIMLRAMEQLSASKVLLITPNGFLPQGNTETGDLQQHLSGWDTDEMNTLGYRVEGLLGPKSLRGEYHRIKKHPRAFWAGVSLLAQLTVTKGNPQNSAAILCVKSK
jgi:SAM-dependent methyltransferase